MAGEVSGVRSALTHAGRAVIPDRSAQGTSLRQVIADRRELSAMTRERVNSPFVAFRFYATTTPGKLVIILLAMILACTLTGWYSSSALTTRSATLESLIDRSEPQAEAAETLYSSLSVADASANSAFISGGREAPEMRAQFTDAIATASTALIAATDGDRMDVPAHTADEEQAREDLNTLAVQIPVYTGLIETARTNNRLGYPVGSAYLSVASTLMQDTILPAAERLYDQRSAAISEPQRTLTVPPWGVYVALFLIIGMLIATNRYLARRTRRHFNIGLLAALAAVGLGTVWLLVSGLLSVAAANTAKSSGADPVHALTNMRILTQQARSAETLSLVRRSDPGELDRMFSDAMGTIVARAEALTDDANLADDAGVTDPLEEVTDAVQRWRAAHAEVGRLLTAGDFTSARALTVGDGAISTATGYREVDAALLSAIADARSTFRTSINTAQRVLGFTGTGIAVLCLVAAAAVFGGLFPRIREYR